ncbi:uncharacterized protein METZ01_LOCUS469567, partial [marine metagenome]
NPDVPVLFLIIGGMISFALSLGKE